MKWVADENVDHPIVVALRRRGDDVWSVAEAAGGLPDSAVLDEANRRTAVLLTGDKDFGELVFRRRQAMHGVVLIRLAGLVPAERSARVVAVLEPVRAQLVGAFTVVDRTGVRIRRG